MCSNNLLNQTIRKECIQVKRLLGRKKNQGNNSLSVCNGRTEFVGVSHVGSVSKTGYI